MESYYKERMRTGATAPYLVKTMKDGFIKAAAATPRIKVGDTNFNAKQIIENVKEAASHGAKLITFPELCITAYTCGDLFMQDALIKNALKSVFEIADATVNLDILIAIGLPLAIESKLYNAAAIIKDGEILGFVTKSHLPNYSEFYEARHFNTLDSNTTVRIGCKDYFAGPKLIFCAEYPSDFKVGVEICEDLWVTNPPSGYLCENGASIILNLSASDEVISKAEYRRKLVTSQSARALCGYVYADAGDGESTTDLVFSGHNLIAENGSLLTESTLFNNGIIYSDIDINRIMLERRKMTTYTERFDSEYQKIYFSTAVNDTELERRFDPHPFVPKNTADLNERCELIFTMQAEGLRKRLQHIGCSTVTIGISGGLDSTLALLVAAKAFEMLRISLRGIKAVTMPCFGTTDRTYNNAKKLIEYIGAEFVEIPINESVTQHLKDIGADINNHNTTYENAQARERTQVLMDYSNETGGIVVGTGDLSELALGWATYNGDHMSMYGVNASIPKTLVKYLVKHVADMSEHKLKFTLYDILETPVSPELLPSEDGNISQQTESLVGPYELHDFFLYYFLRFGFTKSKIYRMAKAAFDGTYSDNIIKKWLDVFYKRFYQNQFKRSCLPDGPKVGTVSLSPRGDWRMPSDSEIIF